MIKIDQNGIYRKSAPTKSTVLGGPPPGLKFIEFIEKLGFFAFLGLQYSRKNRHQSRHLRPTPPRRTPKSDIFRNLSILLIIRDPIYNHGSGNLFATQFQRTPFF
jgi:hypothetical protein